MREKPAQSIYPTESHRIMDTASRSASPRSSAIDQTQSTRGYTLFKSFRRLIVHRGTSRGERPRAVRIRQGRKERRKPVTSGYRSSGRSHTLFNERIKTPKRSDYRKGIGSAHSRAPLPASGERGNAFGGRPWARVACVDRSDRCLMDGDAYSPFFLNPVPSSSPFLSLSSFFLCLSLSSRIRMPLSAIFFTGLASLLFS